MNEESLVENWTFDQFIGSRADFATVHLNLLIDHAATASATSPSGRIVWAEIKRREMVAQLRAIEAATAAANATKLAADQSRRNATWMMLSVVVAAIAAIISAISAWISVSGQIHQ
jgi:hypothetical protein